MSPLVDTLARKSRRALRSAQLALRDGDADGAVNRSYYAMLNSARAGLLSAGVPEDKLPKTHSGLISAFGEHVVKSGKVDPEFGRFMNKTEGFRLRADYTGVELDQATAEEALEGAERFVQAVERAFGLQPVAARAISSGDLSTIQTASKPEKESLWDKSESMEERRRQGVQNWLAYRKKQREAARAAAQEKEAERSRGESRTPSAGRDVGDDPDDG
ncbi:MAG: HEPN domain-containing protein [Steroidobacteraceae bacterium]